MKKFKGKDKLFGDVTIRQDGRVIHPMYLFEVKKPEESKYPVRLLQAGFDHSRRSGVPADGRWRLLAGEVTVRRHRCRHCEERSDEAIHLSVAEEWIASLRSQ